MTLLILLLLVGTPLVEIWAFIEIGGRIGTGPTIALVVLTAIVGTLLLRIQGLGVIERARADLARGEPPVAAVFDGASLLIAGLLLLTPGFFTDAVGGLLLIPPLRRRLGKALLAWLIARHHKADRGPDHGTTIIDADFDVVEEDDAAPKEKGEAATPPRDSRWGRRR